MVATMKGALARSKTITKGYGGMCLLFVQTCYGARAVYGSAIACWNASAHKHRTSSTAGIPVGAPIFFAPHGSPYGHVAVYAGKGMMRTTNSATGRIHTDPVSKWASWGYTLLGWTSDIEGQAIPTIETRRTPMSTARDVWNYGIGSEGKGGYKNTPAWKHLSYAHSDGAYNRKQLDKLVGYFKEDKDGKSVVGDRVADHIYYGKHLYERVKDLEDQNKEIQSKLDEILTALAAKQVS